MEYNQVKNIPLLNSIVICLLFCFIHLCNAPHQVCGSKLTGITGNFSHPEYPEPYSANADCRWTLTAREKDKIRMVFDRLDIEPAPEGRCNFDYFSVFYPTKEKPDRYCGRPESRDPTQIYGTEGIGGPVIRFLSDSSVQFGGFKVRYQIERYDYCLDEPCKNEATCTKEEEIQEGYRCECVDGWTEHDCDVDLDECESDPCQNDGECTTPDFNAYECECQPGYTGVNCETEIDECESEPCMNDAECIDGFDKYECNCLDGFRGETCDENIDECESEPCQHSAECVDGVDGYECTCEPGFEGKNCETNINECSSNPCENNNPCRDDINGYTCMCEDGFEGTHCENDIDECASDPCKNDANCYENEPGKFLCACAPGYTGTTCENDLDECASSPCGMNARRCKDKPNAYECECRAGYEGPKCHNNIDECKSNPCQNGGSCNDEIDKFTCDCPAGYEGEFCETGISPCNSSPCMNGGTCNVTEGEFACKCASGFVGDRCETDKDECESIPCTNGGNCTDGVNRFDCTCADGFGGEVCEIELDECDSAPCENDAKCVDSLNHYECICEEGYIDKNCGTEGENACLSQPCQNNGTCLAVDNGISYKCDCPPGFTGQVCQHESDENGGNPGEEGANGDDSRWKDEAECHPYSCLNNGLCNQEEGYFTCDCKEGFTGKYCETDINECESQPCLNGGSCMDRANSYWCICPVGVRGNICEDTTEADWRRESRLLAAILPSILFLMILAALAAGLYYWMRKKRPKNNQVKNVDVKPKKDNNLKKDLMVDDNKKNDAKLKEKARRNNSKKREKEDIVDYDFSNHVYEPTVVQEKTQLQTPAAHPPPRKPKKAPSALHASQVQYSTVPRVGMVYPTNHPHYAYEANNYPDFRDEYYNPDFYDPFEKRDHGPPRNYKEYPTNMNPYREVDTLRERSQYGGMNKKKYRHDKSFDNSRRNSQHSRDNDADDSLSDLGIEDLDDVDDRNYRKPHWQDRDNDRLNNVSDKHHASYPDLNTKHLENDMPERMRNQRSRPLYRSPRSVTFQEPSRFAEKDGKREMNREVPNKPGESLGREKTSFFPNKTKLHRRNSDDDKGRSRLADKPRNTLRRRQSVDRGSLTPVREEDSDVLRNERSISGDKPRDSPEGDSSHLSGENAKLTTNEASPASYATPFKSIRRNTLRVNEGRGFQREAAFFQD